jgi:hypothetical protein
VPPVLRRRAVPCAECVTSPPAVATSAPALPPKLLRRSPDEV